MAGCKKQAQAVITFVGRQERGSAVCGTHGQSWLPEATLNDSAFISVSVPPELVSVNRPTNRPESGFPPRRLARLRPAYCKPAPETSGKVRRYDGCFHHLYQERPDKPDPPSASSAAPRDTSPGTITRSRGGRGGMRGGGSDPAERAEISLPICPLYSSVNNPGFYRPSLQSS